MRQGQQLVADIEMTKIMVGESSIHVCIVGESPTRADLVAYRLLRSQSQKSLHLLTGGKVTTSQKLSELSVIVLES